MKLVRETLLIDLFKRFDITDKDWMITYGKLSAASLGRIRELQQAFVKAISAIAAEDKELPSDVAEWNCIFFMTRPIDIGSLRNWRSTTRHGAELNGRTG